LTPFLALVGPTASGKTEAGILVAEALGAEVLSIDSMLVYRGMDVGTAKPTAEQRARVPHHLLDLVDPSEPFSVAAFQAAAREAADDVRRRGRPPLLVGGSGLYYRAVVDDLDFPGTEPAVRRELEHEAVAVGAEGLHRRLAGFDPAAAAKIEPGNVRRTVRALEVASITGRPFSSFSDAWEDYPAGGVRATGVRLPGETLRSRIEVRVRSMLDSGWLDEVRRLIEAGFGDWLTATQAIGYSELARHLGGELGLEAAVERIVSRTRTLARRQMAWFRRDPRIRWFDVGEEGAAAVADDLAAYLGAA
jgi:tRNA dimethylallyltransferase